MTKKDHSIISMVSVKKRIKKTSKQQESSLLPSFQTPKSSLSNNKSSSLVVHWLLIIMVGIVVLFCLLYTVLHAQELKAYESVASKIVLNRKPHLIYGTAWKKERTAPLVNQAIRAGFRFIDTACQPKHYNEAGVGQGWTMAAEELGLNRQDFVLQTKFTPLAGQDPNNVPYDVNDSLETQVKTSLQVSLRNLQTSYIDSWVLHSPLGTMEETMRVWRTMEDMVDEGHVRRLGISNTYSYDKFTTLYREARIKPSVLQNRLYQQSNFDARLRQFCRDHKIWYQSFWTLTANRNALAMPSVSSYATKKELTPQTYMFAFLMSLPGHYITPLSGTTSLQHMAQDVAVMERLQGGELLLTNAEQRTMAQLLGFPDYNELTMPNEEEEESTKSEE